MTSVALRKGQAVVTFKRRVKGTVALVAAYGGDRNYLATTSRKVNVRIT